VDDVSLYVFGVDGDSDLVFGQLAELVDRLAADLVEVALLLALGFHFVERDELFVSFEVLGALGYEDLF
jgi:hypothetical protein